MPGKSSIGLVLTLLFTAAAGMATPPLTVVQDILYKADGARFDGIAEIQWGSFQASDGSEIPRQTINIRIIGGNLRVALVPTSNALLTAYYIVKYNSNGRTQFTEYWSVPPSGLPVKLKDVRTPGPIVGGVVAPITGVGILDILGLRSELDLRVSKGPAFATSHAAVINSSGTLDGVSGNPGDCVHVDGTSGPCGSGSSGVLFIDEEAPTGTIDGVNLAFSLSATPTPAASLALFHNGLLLHQGSDYTLSGRNISIVAGRAPAVGDRIQAWFRVMTAASTVYADGEVPTGTLDGVNTIFTLQSTPVPASSLQVYRNGVLQKRAVDYDLTVNTITFRRLRKAMSK